MIDNSLEAYIDRFKLNEWWDTFSDDEKASIKASGGAQDPCGVPGVYLANLGRWLNNPRTRPIALKVTEKAFSILKKEDLNQLLPCQFTTRHFAYMHVMQVFYRSRNEVPGMLAKAIEAGKMMIFISPVVAKDTSILIPPNARKKHLPGHKGFEQLAIIADKQKRYDAVIKICRMALSQGWDGDWKDRIEGAEAMIAKNKLK